MPAGPVLEPPLMTDQWVTCHATTNGHPYGHETTNWTSGDLLLVTCVHTTWSNQGNGFYLGRRRRVTPMSAAILACFITLYSQPLHATNFMSCLRDFGCIFFHRRMHTHRCSAGDHTPCSSTNEPSFDPQLLLRLSLTTPKCQCPINSLHTWQKTL